jgi:hypothetical protein
MWVDVFPEQLRHGAIVAGVSLPCRYLLLPAPSTPSCKGVGSHSLMVSSLLAEASVRPSGAKATAVTISAWPARLARSWPVSASQSLIVVAPADARVSPSGAKATALTAVPAAWPLSVARSLPVSMSQSLIVLFPLPEARLRPSGAKATASIHAVWPLRVARTRPVSASQSLIVQFQLPEARMRPSGEKATDKGSWVKSWSAAFSLLTSRKKNPQVKSRNSIGHCRVSNSRL